VIIYLPEQLCGLWEECSGHEC